MAKDRLKPYFEKLVSDFAFDEFSEGFLKKIKAEDILKGVPLPVKTEDLAGLLKGTAEITVLDLAKRSGFVLGAVPDFPYAQRYRDFLSRILGGAEKAVKVLESEGSRYFTDKDFMSAAVYFRAAIQYDASSKNALYGYALACREIYEASEEEQETGDFKAEFIEILEKLTALYPDFAFPYYYLGYVYLNMGLYTKSRLAWERFIEYVKDDPSSKEASDEINEIKERLKTLDGPVEIEQAILDISAGRIIRGMETLVKYEESEYSNWWPLHYYLGMGYAGMGIAEDAISSFRRALSLSPSNKDVMEELISVYHAIGDEVNEKKYADKLKLVSCDIDDKRI